MSVYEPNSRHLREALIFSFNMKKSAAEAHRMLGVTTDMLKVGRNTLRMVGVYYTGGRRVSVIDYVLTDEETREEIEVKEEGVPEYLRKDWEHVWESCRVWRIGEVGGW
ncbi:hypothetical protein ALC57_00682 [Trachymyrmex cornetzi]|uniref:Mos1 transposase HTH domain-containing protein n=1 Tax=Trachymyrmex cornetzi TaxID=471704 RepID=A0A151JRK5_9HYME|nr:hypothetical protein ALC57_00682 [Trachymyrmex cornetzi]